MTVKAATLKTEIKLPAYQPFCFFEVASIRHVGISTRHHQLIDLYVEFT